MKKFNLNLKKATLVAISFNFVCFNANATNFDKNILSPENNIKNEIEQENLFLENSSIDGLFKRNSPKTNKSPNYYKRSKKPSSVSQYYLRNQSQSAQRCIKKSNRSLINNKKNLNYRHKRHFYLFGIHTRRY